MTFTPLETALIAGFFGTATAIGTKVWLSRTFVPRSECIAIDVKKRLEVLEKLIRILMAHQGIPIEDQLRFEEVAK